MPKKDHLQQAPAAPVADAAADQAPTTLASAPPTIDIRWTPARGNMTTIRTIDEYIWTPGSVLSVALAWWTKHELNLRTSPRETFEAVADAAE